MKKIPFLTSNNGSLRFIWARRLLIKNNLDWSQVIFSDEEKFNYNSQDGYKFYWHDFARDSRLFSKHHGGVQSFILWFFISKFAKVYLIDLEGH